MVSAVIHSIGMFILNAGVFTYSVFTNIFTSENVCTFGENIILLETLSLAIFGYCTCLLGRRQTSKHFARLNDLVGETY
jgi:hypothetical protein